MAEAFRAAGTPVAVLCSTDALYAERAEETIAALRDAGARLVLLAGKADVPDVDGHLLPAATRSPSSSRSTGRWRLRR